MKRIIAIDPSHSGYGIAWWNGERPSYDPKNYDYLTGTDAPGIGCPNLCVSLHNKHLLYVDKRDEIILIIEEPRSHGNMNPVISLNRDIGYIACFFDRATIVLCQASDWKKHLESLQLLPPKSGNIKPAKYKAHLDKHFNMNMKADEWAAWGICMWGYANID